VGESCGKCVRAVRQQALLEILHRITNGDGTMDDLTMLKDTAPP
jgi:NADH:ubiquinone oxidoreductase subunit F (NADH-binding)